MVIPIASRGYCFPPCSTGSPLGGQAFTVLPNPKIASWAWSCFCNYFQKTLTTMGAAPHSHPRISQNSRHLKSKKKMLSTFFPLFIALEPCHVLWGRGKFPIPLCAISETVVKSSYSSWLKWGCYSSCTKLTILSLKPTVPLELTFFPSVMLSPFSQPSGLKFFEIFLSHVREEGEEGLDDRRWSD